MPIPGVVGISHGLRSHYTDEETESRSVYIICPGLVSDISVFELRNFLSLSTVFHTLKTGLGSKPAVSHITFGWSGRVIL